MRFQKTAFVKEPELKKKIRMDTAFSVHRKYSEFCFWTLICVCVTAGTIGMSILFLVLMKIPYGIWFDNTQIRTILNSLYTIWVAISITAICLLIASVIMGSIYIGYYIDARWCVIKRKYSDDLGDR